LHGCDSRVLLLFLSRDVFVLPSLERLASA